MKKHRSVLFYLKDHSGIHPQDFDGNSVDADLFVVLKSVLIGKLATRGILGEELLDQAEKESTCFTLYDWNLDPLPADSIVGSIPRPGIVLAISQDSAPSRETAAAMKLAITQSNDEVQKHLVGQYVNGSKGDFDPISSETDVFISYSTKDSCIAEKIDSNLRQRGLHVFLGHQTIAMGPKWTDQIENAARDCEVAVLIVSEDSRNSDWVRYEIGALWALKKKVAPALVDVDTKELTSLLRDYQARSVASPELISAFRDEVAGLVTQ